MEALSELSASGHTETPVFTAPEPLGARNGRSGLPRCRQSAQNSRSGLPGCRQGARNGRSGLPGCRQGARNGCSGMLWSHLSVRNGCSSMLWSDLSARSGCSKSLFERTALSGCSKSLFERTALCYTVLCIPPALLTLLRAWICTGSHYSRIPNVTSVDPLRHDLREWCL